jgi:muramoyltetrapeptide carboxypeptidase
LHAVTHGFLIPAELRAGDLIRVIAPAGSFDRALFWRGVGWLAETFRVEFSRDLLACRTGTAGSRDRRLLELNRALRCSEAKAIWCARGGFGSGQLSSLADFRALERHPKWLVGFSDITTLHTELTRRRIASLHAANVTGLGHAWHPVRASTLSALLDPLATRRFNGLEVIYPGSARGLIVGGNLTLLHEAAALGRLVLPPGAILFLEEVNEAPYRIARLLGALERLGAFDRVSGIVFGQLSDRCARSDVAFSETLKEFAQRVRVPAWCGVPSGHYLRWNEPLVLGLPAEVRDGSLCLNPARG